MLKKEFLVLKQVLLDELDLSVYQSFIGVVDDVNDRFSSYFEKVKRLKNRLMISAAQMKELHEKNTKLREMFEIQHTDKID